MTQSQDKAAGRLFDLHTDLVDAIDILRAKRIKAVSTSNMLGCLSDIAHSGVLSAQTIDRIRADIAEHLLKDGIVLE